MLSWTSCWWNQSKASQLPAIVGSWTRIFKLGHWPTIVITPTARYFIFHSQRLTCVEISYLSFNCIVSGHHEDRLKCYMRISPFQKLLEELKSKRIVAVSLLSAGQMKTTNPIILDLIFDQTLGEFNYNQSSPNCNQKRVTCFG